jgi:hypothetical protein
MESGTGVQDSAARGRICDSRAQLVKRRTDDIT